MKDMHKVSLTNVDLSSQLEEMPGLKKQLSVANAENARLSHISDARDILVQEIHDLRLEMAALEKRGGALPELDKQLTAANAEAERLQIISKSIDKLLKEAKNVDGVANN